VSEQESEPLAIGHLDIDGVNFAGVKALDARTLELRSQVQAPRAENEALRANNAEMEARIARLEALSPAAPCPDERPSPPGA
jgi:cell division protein FtsB